MSTASMHGLIHVVRRKRLLFERFLWIGLVVAAFAAATQQALRAWHRYEKSPTVTTIEKDFFNWNVEFPSVVVCLRQRSTRGYKFLEEFQKKHNISAATADLEEYVDDLLFNTYFSYGNLEKYANGSKDDVVPPHLYMELINGTIERFGKSKTNKRGAIETQFPKNIEKAYSLILTEFGVCHIFHSKLAHLFSLEGFLGTQNFSNPYKSITKVYKEEDLSLDQNKIFQSYYLFVVSSEEMIDVNSHFVSTSSTRLLKFSIDLSETISDDNIRDLSPTQRNCKFSNENDVLEHSPVYSYNLCRIECRINLSFKYCHCTPYYYRRLDDEPICNMTGMYCLSKHPQIISLVDPKTGEDMCPCFQNCNSQAANLVVESNSTWFLDSTFAITFSNYPKERYKRSLIFTKTDLLIQVGGLFSFFLGCSVLSIIEIPYFLILRFIWGVFGKRSIKPEI